MKLFFLPLSLLLLSVFSFAESNVTAPQAQKNNDPMSRVFDRLGVDSAKKEKIISLMAQSRNDIAKVSIQMDRKKLDLKEMMLNGNVDMAKIKQNCDERGKIWAELQYLNFAMDNEIKKNLTTEQWNQYIQMKIARGENHGPR
jgi:Spy/CpxP family protein refolding chaperone